MARAGYDVAMKHTEWLNQISKDGAVHAIAQRAKIVPRTFARQVERGEISAKNVIAIAIAYGAHPVRALVDTGYLDEKYARTVDPMTALRSVTEDQLADEVLRRMKRGLKTDVLTTDINDLASRRAGDPVSGASASLHDDDDGIVREFDWEEPHAADSSPDEDKLREERGEDLID